MKKYLLLLITFLASFIFTINVKATNVTQLDSINTPYKLELVDYNSLDDKSNLIYTYNNGSSTVTISERFEILLDYFNNQSTYDSYLIITGTKNAYGGALYMFNKSDTLNTMYLTSVKNGDSTNAYYFISILSNSMPLTYYDVLDNKARSMTMSSYNYLASSNIINDINYKIFTLQNSLQVTYENFVPGKIYYASNYIDNIEYKSDLNYPRNITSTLGGKVYNNVYYNDELLFTNGESVLKKTYTYEENIECKDKSKIIINFKPTEEDLKIQFESHFSEHLINEPTLIYEGETTYSYKFNDYIGNRFPLDAQDLYGNELYSYNGKYEGILGPSSLSNFNNIKIEIDLSGYGDYIYYLKFESNLEYNIEFEYITDTIDYFKTISMDNIYGLYLIPKTLNQDLISNITMYGIYNIEIRDTGKDKENPDIIETLLEYNNSNFQYRFEHAYINYLIFFENNQYNEDKDEGYYITFDTRQFNYAIKEGQYDTPTIINPNTGENITISSVDNINKEQDLNSFIKYLEKLFYPENIKNLFNPIYKLFRNSSLGMYIFLVLISSIVILIIKAMKK